MPKKSFPSSEIASDLPLLSILAVSFSSVTPFLTPVGKRHLRNEGEGHEKEASFLFVSTSGKNDGKTLPFLAFIFLLSSLNGSC